MRGSLVVISFLIALVLLARAGDEAPPCPKSLPIAGLSAADIQDTFDSPRGNGRTHEATDILAPRGTAVLAMVDGTIEKLFLSKPGGNTIYEFDEHANYCYYYAHLDRYAEGLQEGQHVQAGRVIGYVGTTGNADPNTPHLHLAITRLGPKKEWWKGDPLNPYPMLTNLLLNGGCLQ
jgi:murein DD-endopeptidase MepM/ murein hydrolase activator NlpD